MMKTLSKFLLLLTLASLLAPPAAQAQFTLTTNDGTTTITGYTGAGGVVTIPDTINGLSVNSVTWSPLTTNTLTSGSSHFSDPQWTNHPARFYCLRMP